MYAVSFTHLCISLSKDGEMNSNSYFLFSKKILNTQDGSGCNFGRQSTLHFGFAVRGVSLAVDLTCHALVTATFRQMNSQ